MIGMRWLLAMCSALALTAGLSANEFTHHDNFEAYTDDTPVAAVWEPVSGTWAVRQERYRGSSRYRGTALCVVSPEADRLTVEATVQVQERLSKTGWATAGVMIYVDGGNFWRFSLVAGPEDQRYCELSEMYRGVWQAQRQGPTLLEGTKEAGGDWKSDGSYRLRIELDPEAVRGTMLDAETGAVLGRESYAFDKAPHLASGRPALALDATTTDFDDVRIAATIGEVKWPEGAPALERGRNATLALLIDDFPGAHRAKCEAIAAALRQRDFGVNVLSGAQLARAGVLHPAHFDALVLPDANVFPANAIEPLLRYLRMGGKMVAIGTRPFATQVHRVDGEWLRQQGLKERLRDVQPTRVLEDFENGGRLRWTRSTNDRTHDATLTIQPGGAGGTEAGAKIVVADLTGWDTFAEDMMAAPFVDAHTLTCFWAKGDRRTPKLSVEWREKDGSRWIAVVELSRQWQHYVLAPEDFIFWPHGSSTSRGGPPDRFDPANAEQIVFGVAFSHTGRDPGPHTFWIDEIGTADSPLPSLDWPPPPILEIISPAYKLYPLTNARRLRVSPRAPWLESVGQGLGAPPGGCHSPVHRPTGQGFRTGAQYRWIPLVEVTGDNGAMRGAPVSMLLNYGGMYRLSAWTSFAFDGSEPWRSPRTISMLAAALVRLTSDLLLCEAGSEYFSYFPDEPITLGAKVVNLGRRQRTGIVRLTVRPLAGAAAAFEKQFEVRVPPQDIREVSASWHPGRLDQSGYTVTCELIQDGRVTDRISHEIGALKERGRFDRASLVTVREGDFYLRGKPWQPHGINYWGLYVAGSEPSGYGLGWLSPGFYQPDVVDRDLDQIVSLGMNMVSIQFNNLAVTRNLLDFLRRAEAHDLKVNVFIGAADPMRFDPEATRQFIEAADLAGNETILAYDISWEPRFGGKRAAKDRGRYDVEWARWIVERYGSIENAERDWGVRCPRHDDGRIASPSDGQLFDDGEWRVMAVAYRRFMSDFLSRRFREAVRQVREYDPHHLVSFRTGASVTGGNGRGDYPYDFAAVAKHVDFLCPEGWALRDDVRPGGFTTAYCHLVAPEKPVMWAEYGYNIWDLSAMAPDPQKRLIQRDRYAEFYRMFLESGARGAVSWYWAGWFRVGEDSDYGICPQDRSERPVWKVIHKYGARLVDAPPLAQPNVWITIDREAHPAGYHHVFYAKSLEYLAAIDAGKTPALRTEGTGTTSANTPLLAVGNTVYNGKNPPKYLNAEFNEVAIRGADGAWVRVHDGSVVNVTAEAPIIARASIGNTAEASWLSPARHPEVGSVYLSSRLEGGLQFAQPIPEDVPYLGDAVIPDFQLSRGITTETRVALEMTAKGRAWFGEKTPVTLRPVP